MSITTLPTDVLILVLQNLPSRELAALSETCWFLHSLVLEFGWPIYLRLNPRPSYSLSAERVHWDACTQVRYNCLADRAWSKSLFVARPLSRPWHGKLQPTIAISSTRLLVAAGTTIYSYKFSSSSRNFDAPSVQLELSCTVAAPSEGQCRDITSITFIPDGGADRTFIIGFNDGSMQRISLPHSVPPKHGHTVLQPSHSKFFDFGNPIESLSSDGDAVLSLSSSGCAGLTSTSSMTSLSQVIDLKARGWSSYLSTSSSSPYAAFGVSSPNPLSIHSITESTLVATPCAILSSSEPHSAAQRRSSAVYGISGVPPSSPWGGSDQIIVSGWYDGVVRVHDLRSADCHTGTGTPGLLPVLSLQDALSLEPIYTVACGGGSSSHIAAGSARHSVVAFWDVRSPAQGWSVHAPGNDSSPVYSIHLESSRLFGATQSRSFVYDFGLGVTHQTYSAIPLAPRGDPR
ncbi:hypothetical protein FIBSPDRAFT_943278 [Athelia psychrophila]|uniref:F-box domain-containing protein n=1 Tax=Athelia psychrophila TaxID=1759441 RepID=A0A166W7V5_9AGAM|nr:hypothetical protein FIBSPDRAFT_943278 [Fibularhizoctonia sp. CBS 109695]